MFTMPIMLSVGEESYYDYYYNNTQATPKELDASDDMTYLCHGNNVYSSNTGAVHIFKIDKNVANMVSLQTTLMRSGGTSGNFFGGSCSINSDGTYVVGGATGANSNTGVACVFTRSGTTWTQQATLVASDGAPTHMFGYGVCINANGDYIVVSCSGHPYIYIFARSGTTWTQQASFNVGGNSSSVSINDAGDRVAVGSQLYPNGGRVFVFERSGTTWSQTASFVGSDTTGGHNFGRSVDIDGLGERIVVGSESAETVYIFKLTAGVWNEEYKLTRSLNENGFGHVVKINKDGTIVTTVTYFETGGTGGQLYKLQRNGSTWQHVVIHSFSTSFISGIKHALSRLTNDICVFDEPQSPYNTYNMLFKFVTRI